MNKEKTVDYKKIVERLSKANWRPKERPWEGEDTLLEIAVMTDNIDLVQDLLELGVDVNLQDEGGKTVLFNRNISVEMVQFLLKHGLEPNLKDDYGLVAIHKHEKNDKVFLTLLPISNYDEDEFHFPTLIYGFKYLDTVRKIIEHFKDRIILDYDSETLLMKAARIPNNLEMIILLAKSGIDLHFRDEEGRDFYDLCFKNVQKVIRKEFPKFMKDRQLHTDVNNFKI